MWREAVPPSVEAGEKLRADLDVLLGHRPVSGPLRMGSDRRLRSGSVLYLATSIGASLETLPPRPGGAVNPRSLLVAAGSGAGAGAGPRTPAQALPPARMRARRMFDVCGALLGLVVTAPLLLLMTGLWQSSGRSRMPMRDGFEQDVRYVEERSVRSHLLVLLCTGRAVLRCGGAR